MIVVVESGSTKADWLIGRNICICTEGINPVYQSDKDIWTILHMNDMLMQYALQVNRLYFFGAGASNLIYVEKLKKVFESFFSNAQIAISHDIAAAVYATCKKNTLSIHSILGTGSNIAWYDGDNMHTSRAGAGYILGDEGSGTHLGKTFLTRFLYDNLPKDIKGQFVDTYGLTRETILEKVYRQENPHLFLASIAPFLSKNLDSSYVYALCEDSITAFFDVHLVPLYKYMNQEADIHFVGSIAYYFSDIVRQISSKYHIQIKSIIHRPIYFLREKYTY